jgi:hypothetical protein
VTSSACRHHDGSGGQRHETPIQTTKMGLGPLNFLQYSRQFEGGL